MERDYATGEDIVVYPRSTEIFPLPDKVGRKPEWVSGLYKHDLQLQAILQETYSAFGAGSFILASVGLRTALDRATEVLQIDPGLSLAGKVQRLKELGFVGETEASDLAVVTDAGSAAAHRGWRPEPEEFERLLSTLERFIERTVVNRKSVEGIAIPPAHPRPKANQVRK
jgi:pantothenate kinase type III